MPEGFSIKNDFVLIVLALSLTLSTFTPFYYFKAYFSHCSEYFFIQKIRNENTDSPPSKTVKPTGAGGEASAILFFKTSISVEGRQC